MWKNNGNNVYIYHLPTTIVQFSCDTQTNGIFKIEKKNNCEYQNNNNMAVCILVDKYTLTFHVFHVQKFFYHIRFGSLPQFRVCVCLELFFQIVFTVVVVDPGSFGGNRDPLP